MFEIEVYGLLIELLIVKLVWLIMFSKSLIN